MNIFEQPQKNIEIVDSERDRTHEQVFSTLINKIIIEEFENDLYEIFEEDEDVEKILDKINAFSDEEQKMILAMPKSIRQKRFEIMAKKNTRNGLLDTDAFVQELFNNAKENGFTLGYHISKKEIIEEKSDWNIKGTDLDDRDDRFMAYYSLDYKNLFRKKRGEYLYVVRAETGPKSTHKLDNTNNWGRADKLSIIAALPLKELDEKVLKISEQRLKRAA